MQVAWLPRAEANLLHIIEHIAEDNVDAALALAKLIRARAEELSDPSTLFRKGRVRDTREMVVHPNCIVVYRVRAKLKRVEILRVLHAARQWPRPEEYKFDRTVVPLRLAQHEGEKLVARSQAKAIAQRFERFKEVVLDFDGVAEIGQAFADELFRVFATAHPDVRLTLINTSAAVAQMVRRVTSASGDTKK